MKTMQQFEENKNLIGQKMKEKIRNVTEKRSKRFLKEVNGEL